MSPEELAAKVREIVADVYGAGGVERCGDDVRLDDLGQGHDYRPQLVRTLGKPASQGDYLEVEIPEAEAALWVTVGDVIASVVSRA